MSKPSSPSTSTSSADPAESGGEPNARGQTKGARDSERRARALRENLLKRKAQSRSRAGTPDSGKA